MTPAPRIDIHAHAFPHAFLQRLSELDPAHTTLRTLDDGRRVAFWNGAPLPELNMDDRLTAMQREGVVTEVLSAPPVYGRFGPHTEELCRLMNELQLGIADAHPGRFLGFIHLPYHEREASLRELQRLSGVPTFVGVTLASNVNGAYPDASLDWLWEALVDHQLPAFVHPVAPAGAQAPIPLPLVHFPSDTTVFAASLILSGALERFPELDVILAHYGGSLSVLGSRLDMIHHPHFPAHPASALSKRPSEYVRHLYVDTAQGFSRPAFLAAAEAFGADRMLYGSDYFLLDTPWRRQLNDFLDPLLPQLGDPAVVLHRNAERLLRVSAQPIPSSSREAIL